ncbi:MAG: PKD domain-containing protein [Solirubrobacteraceae bacterium MAG38_C4-C5]|nr:PKD domain-containing protein [Candidatus Siliceabacter maunaloa]
MLSVFRSAGGRVGVAAVVALASVAVIAVSAGAQQPGPKRVAILDVASTTGGSYELSAAGESGLEATIIDEARWRNMTTADFEAYDALVIGEGSCNAFALLDETAGAWAPAITGNELLIGTDPSDHRLQGGDDLVRDGIAFAADADETGLYIAFECDNRDAEMVALLDHIDGSNGGFATRTADCYNDAHRVADHPAFANTTDASLSGWGCSVHNAFERWEEDTYRVLAIAEGLGTYTAPDGSTGLPYVLAAGESVTFKGRNLVALGDSVSAGEGIGYGYEWNPDSKRWEDTNGTGAFWDVDFGQPIACHQRDEAHPRVLAELTGADLKEHLSCTGATFDAGIKGVQDKEGIAQPQLGGFEDGPAVNQRYRDADPNLVTLSLGANDIEFAKIVASCFYPGYQFVPRFGPGDCENNIDEAKDKIRNGSLGKSYEQVYARIHAADSQQRPIVLHTEYVNPFPAADQLQDCFDIQGLQTSFSGFSRSEINRMVSGLEELNSLIRDKAAETDGAIAVPVSSTFAEHPFCSEDPWIFGMDTGVDPRGSATAIDFTTQAPFHPTTAGQAEIARQIARTMEALVTMRTAGSNVQVRYASGESLTFEEVILPGTTSILKVEDGELPVHPNFRVRNGYQIETAADYRGQVTVALQGQTGDKLWHYQGGSWQQVQSTFDGRLLQGSVNSLSPFAVGPAVTPIEAKITGGEGGVVPEDVAFSASESTGPIDTVTWDFGDGTTGEGADIDHRYRYSGTYEVTATVRSTEGAVDRATKTVTITNPGPTLIADVPTTVDVGEDLVLDSRRSTDPNGSVERGWWQVDGKVVEPVGQRNVVRFDEAGTVEVVGVVADDELKETRQVFRVEVREASNEERPPAAGGSPSGGPSDGGSGAPSPSPSPAAGPLGAPTTLFAAKLQVDRATVRRSDQQLDVLAPITARASGALNVQLHAAGRVEDLGDAQIDAANRRVRFTKGIPEDQAEPGTGIMLLTYHGDADTQPQYVRLRAASQQADLEAGRPTIENGHIKAKGTISERARGVVRVQLLYTPPGQPTRTLQFKVPNEDGTYELDEELPQDVRQGIAQRTGIVHSYTLFTGYYPRRIRGEMDSFQVLPSR